MFGGRFKSRDENVLFSSSSLYPLYIKREKNIRGNMEMTQQEILYQGSSSPHYTVLFVLYTVEEKIM